jgi:hypothetical protein
MHSILSKTEAMLLMAVLAMVAVAVGGPALQQAAHHHHFADDRLLWGIPHAMDVLSNLPFALAGLAGAWLLWRAPAGALTNMHRAMAWLFCAGLVLVTLASSLYHLDPVDATLAVDRYGMVIAMAGLLGLVVAGRVGERAAAAMGVGCLVLGLASVKYWLLTGDILAWAVFQFGGMLLVWCLALTRPCMRALPVNWTLVLLAYGAAKLLESHDHAIYLMTDQLVSGHSLKHVVASMAAWPVLSAIAAVSRSRQNASDIVVADDVAIRWWRNA